MQPGRLRARTKSRKVAKQRKKIRGPARSASSIIRASILSKGLRTAKDLLLMCEKLIPSSKRQGEVSGNAKQAQRTHLPTEVALLRNHPFQRQRATLRLAEYFHRMIGSVG